MALLLTLVTGIQLGRSLANLGAGAGWTWPATDTAAGGPSSPLGATFWTSLYDVLAGDAAAGLDPQPDGRLAGPGLVWAGIAATELTVLVATIWAIVYIYQRFGPGRMRGMATTAEAGPPARVNSPAPASGSSDHCGRSSSLDLSSAGL